MNDIIQDWINGGAGKIGAIDALMRFSARDLVFFFPLLLVLLWCWPSVKDRALNQRIAFACALSVPLALGGGALLGHFLYVARPFVSDRSTKLLINHSPDNSFPSEHATVAFAAIAPIFWFHRRLALGILPIALLVGVARVFVGVHWPGDILAAAALGLVAGAILARMVPALSGPQRFLARFLPAELMATPEEGS